MRKIIIFIIFLIIIFIINLVFYFLSDDYKFFLKKIKTNQDTVYLDKKVYDDKLNTKIFNDWAYLNENKLDEKVEKIENTYELKNINIKSEIVLWKSYLDIVDLFSIYELKKLEVNSTLFDLTDEYPDKYYEFYSKGLTLYLFPTKSYNDLYDIFWILKDELPFSLKEVNNFWNKSFYINLDKNIEDRFIRMIISNNGITFWLKIKRNEYSLVKAKLESLKE